MNFLKTTLLTLLVGMSQISFAQGTCASPLNLGTIGSSTACTGNISNGTTGSAPCAGSGYGGSGGVTYVQFCTGATTACINFNITQGTASGNFAVTVYSANCSTVMDAQCLGNSGTGATFNTSAPSNNAYQPNSCYVARIWNANAGTYNICASTLPATNNYCTGATGISTSPQPFNNFCMTAGSNGSYTEPAAGQFCAGSLENNAWYSFTTLSTCTSPCSVVVTASNIVCSGGGAGFQMGFWTGTCGSLTYLGCFSGAGGAVTTTITGLSPNQTILMGMDGNAGANCTYSLSATNTIPLPIELLSFEATSDNRYVDLKWITVTEKNNDYFTVERSKDGFAFEEFKIVKSQAKDGNSNKNLVYELTDYAPYEGITYYRLKQTDFDKTSKYSDIKAVSTDGNPDREFAVIPNPVQNEAVLKYNCRSEEKGMATILDNRGHLIQNVEIDCKPGQNSRRLDLSGLPQGLYFVLFNTGNKFYKIKLIKN